MGRSGRRMLGSEVSGPPACVPQAVKSDAFFGPAGAAHDGSSGRPAAIQRGATDRQGRAQDVIKNFVDQFPRRFETLTRSVVS
jgi:hypothetical protein